MGFLNALPYGSIIIRGNQIGIFAGKRWDTYSWYTFQGRLGLREYTEKLGDEYFFPNNSDITHVIVPIRAMLARWDHRRYGLCYRIWEWLVVRGWIKTEKHTRAQSVAYYVNQMAIRERINKKADTDAYNAWATLSETIDKNKILTISALRDILSIHEDCWCHIQQSEGTK